MIPTTQTIIATGGTTARAPADRFGDMLSIKDFGTVGNGAVADTAFTDAATYCRANPGTAIFVPEGQYPITTGNINAMGARFVGPGSHQLKPSDAGAPWEYVGGASIQPYNTSNPVFLLGRGASFEGLNFWWPEQVGGHAATTSTVIEYPALFAPLSSDRMSRLSFRNNAILNAYRVFDTTTTHGLGDVDFFENTVFAIKFCRMLNGMAEYFRLSDNFFSYGFVDTLVAAGGEPLLTAYGSSGSIFEIDVSAGAYTSVDGIFFTDNFVYGVNTFMKMLSGNLSVSQIIDNKFDGVASVLDWSSTGFHASTMWAGNSIYSYKRTAWSGMDATANQTVFKARNATTASDFVFQDNAIQYCQGIPFDLQASARKAVLKGNRIKNWGMSTTNTGYSAIIVGSGTAEGLVTENELDIGTVNGTQSGIHIASPRGNVSDNDINSVWVPITVGATATSGVLVRGNRSRNTQSTVSVIKNVAARVIGTNDDNFFDKPIPALAGTINVLNYGADATGVADSYAAFVAAYAALQDGQGQTFLIPPGDYALSQKFTYSKFRTVFDCQGRLIPFGSYSDFLIDFNNNGSDPEHSNLALHLDLRRLEIDGLLQSRGVRFDQLYLSNPRNLLLFSCLGTALSIDNSMECSWSGLVIANGKRRPAPAWVAGASAWSGATAYTVGTYVFIEYAAYAGATTYAANAMVTSGGRSYRSLFGSNTGNTPSSSPTWWQPVPVEYFECMIAHTNRDPHSASNYTTNSSVSGDRYWKQVYAEEAALEIVNTYGTEVVDNQKFFAPFFRHNDHETLVRIDNQANERKVVNIEFYGPQFHQIIDAYIAAFPAEGHVTPDYSRLVQIGHATRCKFFGGTSRSAESEFVTHFQFGWKNPNKTCSNHLVTGMDISGEGQANYGLSIMPGALSAGVLTANDNEYSFTSSATSPRLAGDTTKVVSLRGAHDILTATTPANFSATRTLRVTDAAGTVYYVPATTAVW